MEFLRPSTTAFLLCAAAFSALAVPPETNIIPAAPGLNSIEPTSRQPARSGEQDKRITNDMLAKDPQLAEALLNQAVEDENWPLVGEILPVYEASGKTDATLVLYANAGLARSRGDYRQAISAYRKLLADNPDFVRVRLDLARALYEDRQYEASRYNFEKARSENPPPEVQHNIDRYLDLMNARGGWTGSVNLSYLNDSNINNASSDKYIYIGDKVFIRNNDAYPKRGEGFYFGGTAQRDINIQDNHGLRFKATVNGKSYWNNHDYDDITTRAYLGYLWQDHQQQLAILPFYEKRWYSTEAYTSGAGIRGEYSYLLAADWQTSNALEYQQVNYDDEAYKYLRGHNTLASTTLAHAVNSRLSVFVGADLGEQQTQARSETNRRIGGRLGFESALPYGVSLAAMVARTHKSYDEKNDIFQVKRKDDETTWIASLWHREIYFFDVMPKINFIYKQLDSNIDFYSYDQRSVFLTFDKRF